MSAILNLGGLIPFNATSASASYANAVPVRLRRTPFRGGFGREAILNQSAAIGGSGVVLIQGHKSQEPTAPSNTDSGWTTILTLNSGTRLRHEIDLPDWIRVIVDTAGTGSAYFSLEGTL